MKVSLRQSLLLLGLLVFHFISEAQCGVRETKRKDYISYINIWEQVFLNKDLENGILKLQVRLVLEKNDDPSVPDLFFLECLYSLSGDYKVENGIVPRRVVLTATGIGALFELPALNERVFDNPVPGLYTRIYNYELNAEAVKFIKTGVPQITFYDHRENRLIRSSVYPFLLSEQLNCLQKNAR